ncbi:hypothetical protein [Kitasatospora terrestris]|uniref:FtsX-like permease family protein n=1 Tax=Kitasatospora terrestris TaxID=258051 RepID=A0ABP9DQ34_9ACTN
MSGLDRPGAAPVRVPWVRTRLGAAPYAAVLGTVLVLVAAFLAAALPRALDRAADGALRDLVRGSGPTGNALLAASVQTREVSGDRAADLDRIAAVLAKEVHAPLRLAAAGEVYGSRARTPRALLDPELPRPGTLPPKLGLAHLHDVAGHARLTAGRWPGGGQDGLRFEIAVSQATADTLKIRVGQVLDAGAAPGGDVRAVARDERFTAEVVGTFVPDDPEGAFWAGVQCTTGPCLESVEVAPGESVPYWLTGAVTGTGGLPSLGAWGDAAEDFFQVPIDEAVFRADRLPEVRRALASLISGPQAAALPNSTLRQDLRLSSSLPGTIATAERRQAAAAPLTVLGPVGAAGVALTVLLLAAALATDRRAAELRLLRARGASTRGLLRRLLGESAVTALPAALLGTALALLLLPTPRWGGAVLAGTAVALVGLLALPLGALRALRPGGSAGRRRAVVEFAVVLAAAGAVAAVRRRGVAPAEGGVDLLLVAAPLLLALAGALLLARLHPVLIGGAARAAARRPGAIGFLGLARAARGTGRRPSVLPVFALLLAVTTAGFGATVLAAVDHGRLRAARAEVGADARVAAAPGLALPDGFVEAAGRLPGVRSAQGVWLDLDGSTATADRSLAGSLTVVIADPAAYAALAEQLGVGAFDPALLSGPVAADAPVPALVSPALAERLDEEPRALHLGSREVLIRPVGQVGATPAAPRARDLVVLPAGPVHDRLPGTARANLWLAGGDPDPAALRALLGDTSDPKRVRTSAETVRRLAADPLGRAAGAVFRAAVAAAAGFAVLAVLISLVRSGPERAALLARLRTMGLRPREGLALILTEALPSALLAALAGALFAVLAVLLLGPAVDLSAVVGAVVPGGLTPAAVPVLTQAGLLAAVAAVTVLAEAAISGRRQITTELRAGDDR